MRQNRTRFLDEVLYYLSHLGKMPWVKFKQGIECLNRNNKNPKSDSFYLKSLGSLGHLEYDPAILDWVYIAPAVLVETTTPNQYVLAGSRTPDLISRIEQITLSYGGKFHRIRDVDAASTIVLPDLNKASIKEIEACGVHICGEFSKKLSCILPNLRLNSFEPDESMLSTPIEKFNISTYEYKSKPSDISEGLFRVLIHGRYTHFLKLNNIQRIVPPEWGSWLLLRAFRKSKLIYYKKEQNILQVKFPLTLPLLANRCAVLCSGRIPTLRSGFYCYRNVPIEIADNIAKSLNQTLEVL